MLFKHKLILYKSRYYYYGYPQTYPGLLFYTYLFSSNLFDWFVIIELDLSYCIGFIFLALLLVLLSFSAIPVTIAGSYFVFYSAF